MTAAGQWVGSGSSTLVISISAGILPAGLYKTIAIDAKID
jgi:hypothetical protein